jgi:hypothetical protein
LESSGKLEIMLSTPPAAAEQQKITAYIVEQIGEQASGRHAPECLDNYPRDVYFIGNLRSQDPGPQQGQTAPHIPELLNKLAPVAFGAEFLISPGDAAAVHVRLRWACYYRVFPTLAQQSAYQPAVQQRGHSHAGRRLLAAHPDSRAEGQVEVDRDEDDNEPVEEEDGDSAAAEEEEERAETTGGAAGAAHGRPRNDVMRQRFRKVPCSAEAEVIVRQQSGGEWIVDVTSLDAAIDAELARARDVVLHDPEAFKAAKNAFENVRVPEAALASDSAYQAFLRTLQTPVVPHWRWDVRVVLEPSDADPSILILSSLFANDSPRQLSPAGKENPHVETFLFDTRAQFSFRNCPVHSFSIELAPQGFRYDRFMPARGFNCAVEKLGAADFQTDHMPLYRQQRYQTRVDPPADFAALATDPIPVLDEILSAMEAYRTTWTAARDQYKAADALWDTRHGAEFDSGARQFEDEIARFRRGRDLIRDNADVQLAFKLTNETFRRGPRASWRLFQIVFLVSQLPGLTSLGKIPGSDAAELDKADIIYFPTGGGKTEAYLAVLVFHCFFDRLRLKTAGVTAWIRFPLRLLTLQQMQRVADVICVAEVVRREQADARLAARNVAGFGVGYFVGQTSTPNELTNVEQNQWPRPVDHETWHVALDNEARQRWRRLMKCPSCQTPTIQLDLDVDHARIIHRCANPLCKFPDGRIPVYVIDNEIYRYLPTVLVGTLDKLAGIGNQRKMAQIFGDIDGYCREHGFYKRRCCQRECDNTNLVQAVPAGLSGPTLFLQDELHLLKEGLGTFDGHYETFVTELLGHIHPDHRVKLIASSATIENFERQIEHLYGLDPHQARIFPGPGPSLGHSFYAETLEYPQRLYVGIIPRNKTIFNTILELLEFYHKVLQELYDFDPTMPNPYGGQAQPGSTAWLISWIFMLLP